MDEITFSHLKNTGNKQHYEEILLQSADILVVIVMTVWILNSI